MLRCGFDRGADEKTLEFSDHSFLPAFVFNPRPVERRGRRVQKSTPNKKRRRAVGAGSAVANKLKHRRSNAPVQACYPAHNRRSAADHSTSRATRQALTVAPKSAGS